MLVLSRMRDEKVLLIDPAGQVIATVICVDIRGDKVRLGFEADRHVTIHREELWEEIKNAKEKV